MMNNIEAEFLESEVMFSESDSDSDQNPQSPHNQRNFGYSYRNSHNSASIVKSKRASIPLDIPGIISRKQVVYSGGSDSDDYEDNNSEIEPPHVTIARRNSAKSGSNLKGRNLRQVRNSILRMTGFLES